MKSLAALGCGIQLLLLTVYLAVGGMSVNYLLEVWLQKDIPWYADTLIGLLAGITVPAAIVTWILRLFGAI